MSPHGVVRLVLVVIAVCAPALARAVPAPGRAEVIRNADGTTFVGIVRGDEWNNWVETKAGYTVERHTNGIWYYVKTFAGAVPVLDATPAGAAAPPYLEKHVLPAPTFRKSAPAPARAARGSGGAPYGPFASKVLFLRERA